MTRIAVAGLGHVGLVTAAGFAELGHDVTGVDTDRERVALLRAGHLPLFEPGLDDLLHRATQGGRLRFVDSYAAAVRGAEAVFIAVSTPTTDDGVVDLASVHAAAQAVIHAAGDGPLPVMAIKSTCPVGTADTLAAMLAPVATGRPVSIVVNPEFLSQGSAVRDVLRPDRVVIGAYDAPAAALVAAIHAPTGAPVVRTDPRTAEMVKYAANAFLGTKISFINELASLCDALHADVTQVAAAIGLDPRIGGGFLNAGVGFGGSCLPKDLRALVRMGRDQHEPVPLLEAALAVNAEQRRRAVAWLRSDLGTLRDKTVALLGLAFKPETEDTRESPALDLIRLCAVEGAAVRAHDPVVRAAPGTTARIAADAYEAAQGADAVVLVTEWAQFGTLDLARLRHAMRGDLLLDLRNFFEPGRCEAAGFRYRGVGRAGRPPRSTIAK